MQVEIFSKRKAQWGEGPIWWNDHLYYVDIEGKKIIAKNDSNEQIYEINEKIGCIAPINDENFIYGGEKGISSINLNTKKSRLLAVQSDTQNRFNDGKCDKNGNLWAGTICPKTTPGLAKLYMLDKDHTLNEKISNVTNSNGLAWSQNNKIFYHIDTLSKKIKAYDFDQNTCQIKYRETILDTAPIFPKESPDGMTIDKNDNLWIALCRGGKIIQVSTKNKKIIQEITVPTSGVTSCIFGGKNLNILYITSGIFKEIDEEYAGMTFSIKTNTNGFPVNPFLH